MKNKLITISVLCLASMQISYGSIKDRIKNNQEKISHLRECLKSGNVSKTCGTQHCKDDCKGCRGQDCRPGR